ncbi:hypothetical protein BBJ41_12590 [Burkholderia stabilis]|nr:hypothetical protein BBJ41_12590 [Burkholderia stabilis]
MENSMFGNRRDIFHRDDIRLSTLRKASKLVQQTPLAIFTIKLITLCIARERLTWRASGKDPQLRITKQCPQLFGSYRADVPLDELGLIVSLVRKAARRV